MATWFTQGDTNVYTLIVSSAAALAAVVVGAHVVVWLGMGKVPDELNDLP